MAKEGMKLERRGKYAGVKVHLDGPECELILSDFSMTSQDKNMMREANFYLRLRKKLEELKKEFPDLLKDRTPEEIEVELKSEMLKSELKLDALSHGKDWKGIKVAQVK